MKCRITHGQGDDLTAWDFETDEWTIAEMKLLEKLGEELGCETANEVWALATRESIRAQTLVWWIVRRREEPDLRLGDLDDEPAMQLNFWLVVPAGDEGKGQAPTGDQSGSPISSSSSSPA